MAAPLPNFLGLGTQKGGTTTLHRVLRQHPDVFLPACKEVHFFDIESRYEQGLAAYAARFPECDPGRLFYDASPAYFKEGRDLTQETMVKRGGAAVAEADAAIARVLRLSLLIRNRRHPQTNYTASHRRAEKNILQCCPRTALASIPGVS